MPYKSYEDRLQRSREYNKRYYAEHKQKILERTGQYYKNNKEKHSICQDSKRKRNLAQIENVKLAYGCQNPDCKWQGSFAGCDLDLHHVGDGKIDAVAKMPQRALKKIVEEINKCTVLCANCHRRLHTGLISADQFRICSVILEGREIVVTAKGV